ncbi:hypothetical protein SCA6_003129 [Theobroma cacao]
MDAIARKYHNFIVNVREEASWCLPRCQTVAAKPGSNVEILGAGNAHFRALKEKRGIPIYMLIYQASMVSLAAPKLEG